MAAGCPPILSDRCGNWGYSDTVQHRYNGLVYPCGNVKMLLEAMLTLTDKQTRQLYSQRAKDVFSQQDLNYELNTFLKLISKIKTQKQVIFAEKEQIGSNLLAQKSSRVIAKLP